MAVTSNTYQHLTIQLCDIYGNTCLNVEKDKLKLDICQEGNEDSTANTTNQYCDYLVEGAATPGTDFVLRTALFLALPLGCYHSSKFHVTT